MVAGPHRARLTAPFVPSVRDEPDPHHRPLSSWIRHAREGLQRRQQQPGDDPDKGTGHSDPSCSPFPPRTALTCRLRPPACWLPCRHVGRRLFHPFAARTAERRERDHVRRSYPFCAAEERVARHRVGRAPVLLPRPEQAHCRHGKDPPLVSPPPLLERRPKNWSTLESA